MSKPALDIVLPCYNPQEGWTNSIVQSLGKIQGTLSDTSIRLIVVNDGSSKEIKADLDFLQRKIPALIIESYLDNKGKGFAVRTGVARAEADKVIYTDIDFPYEENGFLSIYDSLQKNQCDVALGIRDENYYENVPPARRFISKLLKSIIRLTLRTPTADTQAGLKGFNKKGREVFLKTTINRYLFDLEFIWLAAKQKDLRIACIPVKVKEGVLFRKMHFSILLTEAWNFLKIFLKP
ncbi:MAG: glycosyltransferase family 2 protein [Chitinophagales bacterium]|nr:glycosyltransferase family 2 protein [Chitinophagales bacterium]